MFPYTDPQFRLDLHNQYAAQLRDEAAAHRLARSLPRGDRRRLFTRRPRPARAPVAQ